MQSESQSNRAPGPRGACREAPPARWNAAGFLPDGAEGNPASRRSRALHPQPKRLALSTPAASRTRLRAAHGHCDPPRDVLSNKVTNLGPSICRIKSAAKMKPTVQGRDPIQSPAPVLAGGFFAQDRHATGRCARQNTLPLSASSKLFLSDHNPRAGLLIRSKIGGHRKAAGPNKNFTARQHRPAIPLPSADVLLVQ